MSRPNMVSPPATNTNIFSPVWSPQIPTPESDTPVTSALFEVDDDLVLTRQSSRKRSRAWSVRQESETNVGPDKDESVVSPRSQSDVARPRKRARQDDTIVLSREESVPRVSVLQGTYEIASLSLRVGQQPRVIDLHESQSRHPASHVQSLQAHDILLDRVPLMTLEQGKALIKRMRLTFRRHWLDWRAADYTESEAWRRDLAEQAIEAAEIITLRVAKQQHTQAVLEADEALHEAQLAAERRSEESWESFGWDDDDSESSDGGGEAGDDDGWYIDRPWYYPPG